MRPILLLAALLALVAATPALERLWRERRDDGLVLVGVNYDDLRPDALEFVRETGMTYPLVVDRDKQAVRDYGLTGVPETFFIDRSGRVVGQITGAVDEEDAEERFRELVERILA